MNILNEEFTYNPLKYKELTIGDFNLAREQKDFWTPKKYDFYNFSFLLANAPDFLAELQGIRKAIGKELNMGLPFNTGLKVEEEDFSNIEAFLSKYDLESLDNALYSLLFDFSLDNNWYWSIKTSILTNILYIPNILYMSLIPNTNSNFRFSLALSSKKLSPDEVTHFYNEFVSIQEARGTIERDFKKYYWGGLYQTYLGENPSPDYAGFVEFIHSTNVYEEHPHYLFAVSKVDNSKDIPDRILLRNYYNEMLHDIKKYCSSRRNRK